MTSAFILTALHIQYCLLVDMSYIVTPFKHSQQIVSKKGRMQPFLT